MRFGKHIALAGRGRNRWHIAMNKMRHFTHTLPCAYQVGKENDEGECCRTILKKKRKKKRKKKKHRIGHCDFCTLPRISVI
jgi:hypothetical protein